MGRRDDVIERYAGDLRDKCGVTPDMDLLRKVTIGCGPSIYSRDASTVAATDGDELRRIRDNFLRGKPGLPDDETLMGGIQSVLTTYGRGNPAKYRAMVYYLLVKHFGKDAVYG